MPDEQYRGKDEHNKLIVKLNSMATETFNWSCEANGKDGKTSYSEITKILRRKLRGPEGP
jgi:hypothetical protein